MFYIYVFLCLIAVALIYMYLEAGFVEVNHVRFTKSKKCLKVLQISDIHIDLLRVSAKKVASVVEKENPDIIILTGDYIRKPSDIPDFLDFLKKSAGDRCIYACLGNHDNRAFLNNKTGLEKFIRQLEAGGVIVLENKSILCKKGGNSYNIIGIGDIKYGTDNIEKALDSSNDKHSVKIALSHNPDIVLKLPRGSVDYLLCGHFHGGQIWAPFDLEFKLLRNENLCRMGIKRGLHKVNNINLYINRGLGNVCVPLRFMSRPEITVFHI